MKSKIVLLLATLLLLAGCESETEFGKCVGVNEVELENPALHYKISTTNVIVGLVFWEAIFTPAVVLLDETYCPVGKK
jgi:hypothetical protein